MVLDARAFDVVVKAMLGEGNGAVEIDKAALEVIEQQHPTNNQQSDEVASPSRPVDQNAGEIEAQAMPRHVTLTLAQVMERVRRVPDGEFKGFGSVYDVLKLVSGNSNVRDAWTQMSAVVDSAYNWHHHKFPGERQRNTPVADVSTLIEIVWDCPGTVARAFRRQCADLIKRVFEGDETVINEIRHLSETVHPHFRAPGYANLHSPLVHCPRDPSYQHHALVSRPVMLCLPPLPPEGVMAD